MAVQIAPFEPVCFWPSGQHECYRLDETQPVTATIAWCNADGTVNIGGLDHRGAVFAATDVKVLAHPPLPGQVFERCCWHAFGQRREVPVGTTTLTFSDEQEPDLSFQGVPVFFDKPGPAAVFKEPPNDLQAGGLYHPKVPPADIPDVPDELKDVFDHAKP